MSQMKWPPLILLTALLTPMVQAEPSRPFYSLENQLPRWEQLEVGVGYSLNESDFGNTKVDTSVASVYARYGLLDNLAMVASVPFVQFDPSGSDSESGLGDVELGFQLRAYEDIFGYPYFIPYINVSFPTGDEDKGLGSGDASFTGGISYGSKINNWIDWVLDVGYTVNSDIDNQIRVGHSYIWNVSEDFALITEVRYEQAAFDFLDDDVLLSGGFSYNWTPELQMAVSVAAGAQGATDVEGYARLSYSF